MEGYRIKVEGNEAYWVKRSRTVQLFEGGTSGHCAIVLAKISQNQKPGRTKNPSRHFFHIWWRRGESNPCPKAHR
ncbi:MAG: DUF4846 domain-containing protein [Thermosediminibacteraceae bacterium]|nr:DUF4846 domain-containing protein [Thermosediminibacteraceae bacterium]